MTTRTRRGRGPRDHRRGAPKGKRPPAKGRATRGPTTWHIDPGRCFVCTCTDDEACEGGCYWVDAEHTLCSTCAAELALLFMAWIRRRRP